MSRQAHLQDDLELAIGKLLRDRPVPLVHVAYETVVAQPEAQMERVFAYMDVPNEPEAVDYGDRFQGKKGPGGAGGGPDGVGSG